MAKVAHRPPALTVPVSEELLLGTGTGEATGLLLADGGSDVRPLLTRARVKKQVCFLPSPSSPAGRMQPPEAPGGWQSHRGAGAYIPESLSGEELPTTWTSTCVKINIPCVGAPRFLGLGAVSSPVIKDFLSSQAPVMLLWLKARQRNYLAKGIHPHDPRPPKVRKAGALQSVSLLALL